METNVKEIECLRCGYCWVPRIPVVRVCPSCKSPWFDVPKKEVEKKKEGEAK